MSERPSGSGPHASEPEDDETPAPSKPKVPKLDLSRPQWRQRLDEEQFRVLRLQGTERAFTSPLYLEQRPGTYTCVGCGEALFSSEAKYESGTGWPSFFQAIEGSVESQQDYHMAVPRIEYHCVRCGGHHGHVFKDGPEPTGLRYCNNGVSLAFVPRVAGSDE
jgi:peptide-methionine (R)-S-oxide reductase